VEQPPVLHSYPEFEDIPGDCQISVYSLNEIATEKVVALQDRAHNEPRDLYDLWFLTSHAVVEIGHLIGAITKQSAFGKKYHWHRSPYPRKRARIKTLWASRLGHQMEALPEYDEVFRTLRRELHQAGFPE
jgi:uncharacterized protein